VTVVRDTDIWNVLPERPVGTEITRLGGRIEHLRTKSEGVLQRGDVFVFHPPGGGGFGDPLDREPEKVRADVVAGAVSNRSAFAQYGVSLDSTGGIDEAATTAERRRRRTARTQKPDSTSSAESNSGTTIPTECPQCASALGDAGASRWTTELSHAGPWLAKRWNGKSPNFELLHQGCPSCGSLWDVSEVRKPIRELASPGV
jgi:N-methylhydantoinase B